jgi:hypothetical protein
MKITKVSAIPMSAPVPTEKRHRTDLETKVKSDAHSHRNRQRTDWHRRGTRNTADHRGHRRARTRAGMHRRGPDVLRARFRKNV